MFTKCDDCGLHYDDAAEKPRTDRHDPKIHDHAQIQSSPLYDHVTNTRRANGKPPREFGRVRRAEGSLRT
jgi:hypothetical protein